MVKAIKNNKSSYWTPSKVIIPILIIVILLISFSLFKVDKENTVLRIEIQNQTQDLKFTLNKIDQLQKELKDSELFNRYYQNAISSTQLGDTNRGIANSNYDLSSQSWDLGYLSDSRTYCIGARDVWSASNEDYQFAIANYKEAKKYSPTELYTEIIEKQIGISNMIIDINWAMYEACEGFESASLKYEVNDILGGDTSLKSANEKIKKHDSLIKPYNAELKELEILLDKLNLVS